MHECIRDIYVWIDAYLDTIHIVYHNDKTLVPFPPFLSRYNRERLERCKQMYIDYNINCIYIIILPGGADVEVSSIYLQLSS